MIKKNAVNKGNSGTSNKRSELLIKVDDLMEKLDNEYGPFLLEELNKRLEKTIENFHNDLKSILDKSFNDYNMKLKEISQFSPNENEDPSTPSYIAEYEEKIKNKKNN